VLRVLRAKVRLLLLYEWPPRNLQVERACCCGFEITEYIAFFVVTKRGGYGTGSSLSSFVVAVRQIIACVVKYRICGTTGGRGRERGRKNEIHTKKKERKNQQQR
jgi:hypothetical protein